MKIFVAFAGLIFLSGCATNQEISMRIRSDYYQKMGAIGPCEGIRSAENDIKSIKAGSIGNKFSQAELNYISLANQYIALWTPGCNKVLEEERQVQRTVALAEEMRRAKEREEQEKRQREIREKYEEEARAQRAAAAEEAKRIAAHRKIEREKLDRLIAEWRRRPNVYIGMNQSQVISSKWGRPEKINKTEYAWGTNEQWCYTTGNYLYFKNGILYSTQTNTHNPGNEYQGF